MEDGSRYHDFLTRWNSRRESSTLNRMLYCDQKTYLVELLMKQDQMSMAASIESRVPFLDHRLVEFAARLPDRLKLRATPASTFSRKRWGPAAGRDHPSHQNGLPHAAAAVAAGRARRPAAGQLADPNGLLAAYANRHEVEQLVARHRAGEIDATDRIWRLLNFELWGDIFITGRQGRLANPSWP